MESEREGREKVTKKGRKVRDMKRGCRGKAMMKGRTVRDSIERKGIV
jgi:hypothetical protein